MNLNDRRRFLQALAGGMCGYLTGGYLKAATTSVAISGVNSGFTFPLTRLLVLVKSSTYNVTPVLINPVTQSRTNLSTQSNIYLQEYSQKINGILIPGGAWLVHGSGSTSNSSYDNYIRIDSSDNIIRARSYSGLYYDYGDFSSFLAYNKSNGQVYQNLHAHPSDSASGTRRIQFNPDSMNSSFSISGYTGGQVYSGGQNQICTFFYDHLETGVTGNYSSGLVVIGSESQSSYNNVKAWYKDTSFSDLSTATSSFTNNPSRQNYVMLSSNQMIAYVFGGLYNITRSGNSIAAAAISTSDIAQGDSYSDMADLASGVWYYHKTRTFRKGWPNQWAAPLDISNESTADFAFSTYYQFFGYMDSLYMIGKTSGGDLRVTTVKVNLNSGTLASISTNTYGAIGELYPNVVYKNVS